MHNNDLSKRTYISYSEKVVGHGGPLPLWLISDKENRGTGCVQAFVIRAYSDEARRIAQRNCGAEGPHIWLSNKSIAKQLGYSPAYETESKVILRSIVP